MAKTIMARNKPKKWTDGLVQPKTATNPKGGGRVTGRDYSYLNTYPGEQAEYRMSWSRMKAQAKYRDEGWDLTWEQYQEIWADKWHLKGRGREDLCLTRIDWTGPWSITNVSLVFRIEHLRKQSKVRPSRKGRILGPRQKKNK
jgi:hypothetical protein